jgi:hypothetical protein
VSFRKGFPFGEPFFFPVLRVAVLSALVCWLRLGAHVRAQTTVFPACDALVSSCQEKFDAACSELPFCNCTRKLSCFYGRCQGNASLLGEKRTSFERQCRTVYNCSTCDLHLKFYEKLQPPNYEAILLALFSAGIALVLLRAVINFFASVSESRRIAEGDGLPPLVVIHAAPDQQNRPAANDDDNDDDNHIDDGPPNANAMARRNSHPLIHMAPPRSVVPREDVESSSDSNSR